MGVHEFPILNRPPTSHPKGLVHGDDPEKFFKKGDKGDSKSFSEILLTADIHQGLTLSLALFKTHCVCYVYHLIDSMWAIAGAYCYFTYPITQKRSYL